MAFFDNNDASKAAQKIEPATSQPNQAVQTPVASTAQQPVIVQQASRSKLMPALFVTFNLLLLVVIGVLFKDKIFESSSPEEVAGIENIDPKLLLTPEGRKLDIVVFGNNVFEVTRISYSQGNPRSSSVTLTVPGNPPKQAVKHTGETFASGAISIAEITSGGVYLEANGDRKFFGVDNAGSLDWANNTPKGKVIMPAKNQDDIPDAPAGKRVVPKDPREEIEADDNQPEPKAFEDLQDIREIPMNRADYLNLIRELPDIFKKEFVLQAYYNDGESLPYGVLISGLATNSFFYTHGLKLGDVILNVNDEEVRRVRELDIVAASNAFHDELRIDLLRGEEVITYLIYPGVSNALD
ncbi:MAG: hypothetical protein V3V10_08835 [Planctomycetota bacterium]